MPVALTTPGSPRLSKRLFAKTVAPFAKRVGRLPGRIPLTTGSAAAIVLMTVTGGFGTGAMPLPVRAIFWAGLIGWNAAKWQAWFAWRVRRPADWPRAAAIGALVLNLPLPFEVDGALALAGLSRAHGVASVWAEALAISATLWLLAAVLSRRRATPEAPASATSAPAAIDALLARVGVLDRALLVALEAEDHYCRLHLADGRAPLIHARFGDAVEAAAALDGERVHRGAWAAAAHVAGARREGRRWWLLLDGGARLPISARYLPAIRARGWLVRSGVVLHDPAR